MKPLNSIKNVAITLTIAIIVGVFCVWYGDLHAIFDGMNPLSWVSRPARNDRDTDRLPAQGDVEEWMVEEAGGLGRYPESMRKPNARPGLAPASPSTEEVAPAAPVPMDPSRPRRLRQGRG
ncbi:MAG: hypothetical protein AB7I30_08845 [Isosphaeraceae bacterium]